MAYKKIDYSKVEDKYDPNLTDLENAINCEVSENTFRAWRKKKGLPAIGSKNIDYDEVGKKYDPILTDKENAVICGISEPTFIKWRKSRGYEAYGTPIRDKEFLACYNARCSDSKISYLLGKSELAIQRYREKKGLPANPETTEEIEFKLDKESLYCDSEFLIELKQQPKKYTTIGISPDIVARLKDEQVIGETQGEAVDRILDEVDCQREILLEIGKTLEKKEDEKKIVEELKKILGVE